MAERRMLTKKVTNNDNFTSLSSSAQALYLHLNQSCDDDGFCDQVTMAMFKAHATPDDLSALLAKSYIIQFDSGVIAIKHWRMHNTIRKDRYTPTNYQEELKRLGIKTDGSYTLDMEKAAYLPLGCQMVAKWLPDGCQVVATGKESLGKESIGEEKVVEERTAPPPTTAYGRFKNVILTDAEYAKLKQTYPDHYDDRIERFSEYMDKTGKNYKHHFQTIMEWAKQDGVSTEQAKPKSYDLDAFFEAAVKKGAMA